MWPDESLAQMQTSLSPFSRQFSFLFVFVLFFLFFFGGGGGGGGWRGGGVVGRSCLTNQFFLSRGQIATSLPNPFLDNFKLVSVLLIHNA